MPCIYLHLISFAIQGQHCLPRGSIWLLRVNRTQCVLSTLNWCLCLCHLALSYLLCIHALCHFSSAHYDILSQCGPVYHKNGIALFWNDKLRQHAFLHNGGMLMSWHFVFVDFLGVGCESPTLSTGVCNPDCKDFTSLSANSIACVISWALASVNDFSVLNPSVAKSRHKLVPQHFIYRLTKVAIFC